MSEQQSNRENDVLNTCKNSTPLTTSSGIEDGIRFFRTAMSALDRIENLLEEIEETRSLVHQMMADFSLAGKRTNTTPVEQKRKKGLERKHLKEREIFLPR